MTGHLIHIGYAKTGSNFLRRWFAGHPQLAYADGGIAGFRTVYEIAKEGAEPRDGVLYRVTSCEALATPHAFVGAEVVDYPTIRHLPAAQEAVCGTLAALFPNAYVLLLTRGFRSMILSSYSQYVRSGGDRDLGELIANVRDEEAWNYDAVIGLYTRAFGEARVLVMPYELLRDDAGELTRLLAARLGIDNVVASQQRVNESLSPIEMCWYPGLSRLVRRTRSRKLIELYSRARFKNRLGPLIAGLQRLRPRVPVTAAAIPDDLLNTFRGKAELLRDNPLYAPYAADYLHGAA